MKKYIYISIVIAILSIFNFTITNALSNNTVNTVWTYDNLGECKEKREANENNTNPDYRKYERSKCYSNNGKYQYNICEKGKGCKDITSISNSNENINTTYNENIDTTYNKNSINPYNDKIIILKSKSIKLSMLKEKIDKLIIKVKWQKDLKTKISNLNNFLNKLNILKNKDKYKGNNIVQNLVWYIQFEIKREISILEEELKKQNEEKGINDFLCELSWYSDCNKRIGYCPDWYEKDPTNKKRCRKGTKIYFGVCLNNEANIGTTNISVLNTMMKNKFFDKFWKKPMCYWTIIRKNVKDIFKEMEAKMKKINWKYVEYCTWWKKMYDTGHIYKCFDVVWKPSRIEERTTYKYLPIKYKMILE